MLTSSAQLRLRHCEVGNRQVRLGQRMNPRPSDQRIELQHIHASSQAILGRVVQPTSYSGSSGRSELVGFVEWAGIEQDLS